MALFPLVHILKANGAAEAPFADFTLCGLPVDDKTSAMWPGEPLRGFHWGEPYRVKGSWCADCRNVEKVKDDLEEMIAERGPEFAAGVDVALARRERARSQDQHSGVEET